MWDEKVLACKSIASPQTWPLRFTYQCCRSWQPWVSCGSFFLPPFATPKKKVARGFQFGRLREIAGTMVLSCHSFAAWFDKEIGKNYLILHDLLSDPHYNEPWIFYRGGEGTLLACKSFFAHTHVPCSFSFTFKCYTSNSFLMDGSLLIIARCSFTSTIFISKMIPQKDFEICECRQGFQKSMERLDLRTSLESTSDRQIKINDGCSVRKFWCRSSLEEHMLRFIVSLITLHKYCVL